MAREHAEVITAGSWMLPAFTAATLVGLALVAWGLSLPSGWALTIIVVFGVIVVLVAVGSLGFFLWGRLVGFGWHCTP